MIPTYVVDGTLLPTSLELTTSPPTTHSLYPTRPSRTADEPDYEVDDDPLQAQRLDVSGMPLCITVSQVQRWLLWRALSLLVRCWLGWCCRCL